MTTNLIEQCFEQERLEESNHNRFINIGYLKNSILVVDPYFININDLKDLRPGRLVRVRRPGWGRGDIHRFIHKIDL